MQADQCLGCLLTKSFDSEHHNYQQISKTLIREGRCIADLGHHGLPMPQRSLCTIHVNLYILRSEERNL